MNGDYPTVRRTSAAAAPSVALPQSSPFAAGQALSAQAKKRPRTRLDPAQVEIESGIPLPEQTRPESSTYAEVVKRMKVGDVAWFETKTAKNFTSWLKKSGYQASHRAGTGKREGQQGVWLLALPAGSASAAKAPAKKGAGK